MSSRRSFLRKLVAAPAAAVIPDSAENTTKPEIAQCRIRTVAGKEIVLRMSRSEFVKFEQAWRDRAKQAVHMYQRLQCHRRSSINMRAIESVEELG